MPRKALLEGLRPSEKFHFVVISLFILGLIFQLFGAFVAGLIYGYGFSEILSLGSFDDPKYVAASKLIQIIGSIGTFIIPALLFSYLFEGNLFSYYRFRDPTGGWSLLLTILMIVSVIPFINYMAEINLRMKFPIRSVDHFLRQLEGDAEEVMRAFTATRSFGGLLVNLLMVGVIAAVGEELIFRGVIQRLLHGMVKNIHLAVLIASILFSAFHFQFFSFLPRFILGLVMGYLMYYGRSIWYPILAHFVNNAMGVTYYYFNSRGSADDMLEEIGTSTMLPMAALVSLLLFVFFGILWLYQTRTSASQYPPRERSERY